MQAIEGEDERASGSQLLDEFGELAEHAVASDAEIPLRPVEPNPERLPATAFVRATWVHGGRAVRPLRRRPAHGTADRAPQGPRCTAPPRRGSPGIGRVRCAR